MDYKLLKNRYKLADELSMLTPCVLLYPEVVRENIKLILKKCKKENLRPHIKTIKCKELVGMLQQEGVNKFKCATLKEASLLGEVAAADVLLAYPLVGANVAAYLKIIKEFPETRFQVIIDSWVTASVLNEQAGQLGLKAEVFIDLNLGMNRTGIALSDAFDFAMRVLELPSLQLVGLHGYDGHIQQTDLKDRYENSISAIEAVFALNKELEELLQCKPRLVLGGSNTFPFYSELPFVECSPGTFILWDWGYASTLKEQPYQCAAILATRIISKPTASTICLDLGHKAVAAENTIDKRVLVLGHPEWNAISQSEEHLVMQVSKDDWEGANIGDMYYMIPYHVCPTIAKYPAYHVIVGGNLTERWSIAPRF